MKILQRLRDHLFKTKEGNYVYGQFPNWPIWVLLGISGLNMLEIGPQRALNVLFSGILLYWGYLELAQGVNRYRKILGLLAVGYSILRLVQ